MFEKIYKKRLAFIVLLLTVNTLSAQIQKGTSSIDGSFSAESSKTVATSVYNPSYQYFSLNVSPSYSQFLLDSISS
jgi:hypothetical protein